MLASRIYTRFRSSKWCKWPHIPKVKLGDITSEWNGSWKSPPHRLLHETIRLFPAIVALVFSAITLTVCIQYSDQKWAASADQAPLLDILLDKLPYVDSFKPVDDIMLSMLFLGIAIGVIWVSDYTTPRLALVRRFCTILAFLLLFRTLAFSITTLPSPSLSKCVPVEPISNSFGPLVSQGLQLIFGSKKACTDNLFSGHATFMTLGLLLILHHAPHPAIKLYGLLHWWAGVIMILVTRLHYTIDVIMAVFITVRTWESWLWVVREAEALQLEKLRIEAKAAGDEQEAERKYAKAARRRGWWWGKKIIAWVDGVDLRVRHPAEDEKLANHTNVYHGSDTTFDLEKGAQREPSEDTHVEDHDHDQDHNIKVAPKQERSAAEDVVRQA